MWNLLIPAVMPLLDKILPDAGQKDAAKLKVLEMAQNGELAALNAEMQLALGQIEINKEEAKTDLFRGGCRPAVGWVCVFGLGYQFWKRERAGLFKSEVRSAKSENPDHTFISRQRPA